MTKKTKIKLTDERAYFKPFKYPQFYDRYVQHKQADWNVRELSFQNDIEDWKQKLNEPQKKFLTHIFRFFTDGDITVAGAYVKNYLPTFPQPEVRMMLLDFAAREATHIDAYSHVIETLGLPETIYNEFMQYKAMADKHNYVEGFVGKDSSTIAQQMAIFSAFTEGLQLFSSFVLLLNFPRNGIMKSMGQVLTWSIADESMHVEGITELFRVFISENRDIWTDELKTEIYEIAKKMVELEDAFIDLAYSVYDGSGVEKPLLKEDVKLYIRYIADRRLLGLGMKPIFGVKKNPLPWVDEMVSIPTHVNFFENKSTDYAKGALTGSWGDVWASHTEAKVPEVHVEVNK
jgi:ribonucleoside-diphosphate reductase beta chain